MPVNMVNSSTAANTASAAAAADSAVNNAQKSAAAEKSEETKAAAQDKYVKSNDYTIDTDKISSIKSEMSSNVGAFKKMVAALIGEQSEQSFKPYDAVLNIDKATQTEAQSAISDGGYWGVEQTASRILEFAKSLTCGDPAKADAMRDAFEKGFKEAEKIWGGKLPEISQKTYDRVMEGFDEWKKSGETSAVQE